MDVISYALSKKIAAHAVSGVQSMSVNGQTLTINTKDSGVLTMTFPTPKDGVSVTDIDVNANNQIVFTMSDGSEFISGKIPTVKGEPGFSPTIIENADNTDKIYKLDITTADSTFTTPNLRGADGQGGGGGDSSVTLTQEEYEALTEEEKLNGLYYIYDTKRIYKNGVQYGASEPIPLTMAEYEALKEAGAIDEQQEYLIEADDEGVLISAEDIGYNNAKSGIQATTVQDAIDKIAESGGSGGKNVQSDWNETDNTADGFIKNKPIIPEAYDDTVLSNRVKTIEDNYAKSSDIPSLSGYATETWVNEQGFLTQHQDLSAYATKDEIPTVPSKVSELTNDSNYQTAEQVNSTVTTEIAKVVADAPEDFDTLKEMSDWIAGHEDDASAMNSAISDNKTAITVLQTGKADKSDIPTSLPANGGNADTVNNHTVKSDVPENAVFTDTVYDDAELQKRISDNGYGEVAGGKNLATVSSFSTQNNEIIFTKKDDSTLIANGSNCNQGVGLTKIFLAKAGITYTAQIITDLQLNMFIWNSDENILVTSPISSKEISFSVAKDTHISIAITTNNVVFNNTEIKVQLEEGSVATEYEPYFPSNKMLAEEKADKSETTVNRLNPKLQTTTKDGVTCTNNGDGTYTLNGTAVSTIYFFIQGITYLAKKTTNKYYKLVGCPTGGTDKYDLRYEINGSTTNGGGKDFGDGVIIKNDKINSTDITSAEIIITVLKGVTVNNLVFKPMLTTNLDATYDDFVPYTGDSGSLNGDVAKLKNDLDKLSSLPIGSIIQIEADKDNIETTIQKYGWQYLGTSNIECNDGSVKLLVTNVYRKNN